MYNRYIPQPDGSYSRRQYQDTSQTPPRQQSNTHPQEQWQPEPEIKEAKPEPAQHSVPSPQPRQRQACRNYRQRQPQRPTPPPPQQEHRESPRQERRDQNSETNVLTFLRQLLPKNFDTGDLLIVLLLLLMSGDCQEDQNTALLTLVLYLFL